MKIKITWAETYDHGERQEMYVDGKYAARAGGGEPEDMIIGRDIMSMDEVAGLMKEAFNAGMRGENWELERVPESDG